MFAGRGCRPVELGAIVRVSVVYELAETRGRAENPRSSVPGGHGAEREDGMRDHPTASERERDATDGFLVVEDFLDEEETRKN